MPTTLQFGTQADYENRNYLVDALRQRIAAGMESVPHPSLKKSTGDTLRATPVEVDPTGFMGSMKLTDAREVINELMKRKFPQGIAVKRFQQYPPGTQHTERTGLFPEISRMPKINNMPYPGAFSESDLARRLNKYTPTESHHGFYTPKGNAVELGGESTHSDAIDRLLGYDSPNSGVGNSFVNDMMIDNPINRTQTYGLSDKMSDTGLTRVYRGAPRFQQRSYLDFPPNVTDEQIDTISRMFGKPRYSTATVSPPTEFEHMLRADDPRSYQRLMFDDLAGANKPIDQIVKDLIGNYATDLTRHFRK